MNVNPPTQVSFLTNGTQHTITVPPMKRLLDVLREDLGLTGTKEGCGEGECGACTVLLDGLLVLACMVPICQVQNKSVTTIEGSPATGRFTKFSRRFMKTAGLNAESALRE